MLHPKSRKIQKNGADQPCIFIHAGAGYHSLQNEKIHLQACNEYVDQIPTSIFHLLANPGSAAKAAMVILRTGGTALDAVEIAIKVLEDREITNAGYGSNLAVDGVVECDATIVDHFGRSGAVGAVSRLSFCHTTIHSYQTDTMQRSKTQSHWLARFWTVAHSYSL